ncbi:hypothetical protein BO78DRAFT_438119 [Aspergillus sclerotiicarbonarius CBS 121057]|uniref:P-loop containing nucleoside triphosphate hydrolase protein n=1 Tax=Aspergillus sclerotiicarbonarius (strain CBS 121057 / IBT 28362) TaxID=1448318 RepID=A0A319EGL6_ASPSB|nr:hypothetical protein BO78DRAFT_438119 [Aspergillus sclerotiicarbonarius CBS 121057]
MCGCDNSKWDCCCALPSGRLTDLKGYQENMQDSEADARTMEQTAREFSGRTGEKESTIIISYPPCLFTVYGRTTLFYGNELPRPIIGIFGLPGSGKSHLLEKLKAESNVEPIEFHDPNVTLAEILRLSRLPGGQLVVARNPMLQGDVSESKMLGAIEKNIHIYSLIMYLDVSPETIMERRQKATEEKYPEISVDEIQSWKEAEKSELCHLCRDKGILFTLVRDLHRVSSLILESHKYTRLANQASAERALHGMIENDPKAAILIDDGSLTAESPGKLFWQILAELSETSSSSGIYSPNEIFDSNMEDSYTKLLQVSLLYDEIPDDKFNEICKRVASKVTVHR